MTLDELYAETCAYLNRRPQDFIRNGVNLFTTALNRVRRGAQKMLDFELLRCQVTMDVPLAGQILIDTGMYTPLGGAPTTVRINRIERAFIPYANALRPIDFLNKATIAERDRRRYDDRLVEAILSRADLPVWVTRYPVFVRDGRLAYLWPNSSPTYLADPQPVSLDVVRWAEDYTSTLTPISITNTAAAGPLPVGNTVFYLAGTYNGEALYATARADSVRAVIYYDLTTERWRIANQLDQNNSYWQSTVQGVNGLITFDFSANGFSGTASPVNNEASSVLNSADFFLTDCEEWLFAAVCRQLQYYLKSDERTAITLKQLDEAWTGVQAWNSSIASSAASQSYDLD